MNVLVVGGGGFIGSFLFNRLESLGHRVVCTTRGAVPINDENSKNWVKLDHWSQKSWNDLLSREFDLIYHLGWSTVPRTADADPVADLIENVGAGLRLLISVATISPSARIIFASSGGTVYGRTKLEKNSESDALKPISTYGVSKLSLEYYMGMFRAERGVDAVCARISNPYGPGQYKNRSFGAVSTFVHRAAHGERISIFGSGEITRDYIYIADLCEALIQLGALENAPDVVNIGSGIGTSLFDIIFTLEELLGRAVDYELIEGRSFDVRTSVLDISKILNVTDWKPKVSLREGMANVMSVGSMISVTD